MSVDQHTSQATPQALGATDIRRLGTLLARGLGSVVSGHPEAITLTLAVVLARGHLLVEDVPGVGKTTLVKALGVLVGGDVGRIQFTPDLLPSDVVGVSVYTPGSSEPRFRPGPVFHPIVIADEINRASPKAQAALLECMAERQVTVDGTTYALPRPFIVVATQNPIDMEGTYPLPEAQRDRFMARIPLGYPSAQAERAMLEARERTDPLDTLQPIIDIDTLEAMCEAVDTVYTAPELLDYVVALVRATREHPAVRVGASPRAALQLVQAARAAAALAGRPFVVPDDVKALATAVLAHRLIVAPTAPPQTAIVADVLAQVPTPRAPARQD